MRLHPGDELPTGETVIEVLTGGFSEVAILKDGFGGRKALKLIRDDILERFGRTVSHAFFEECRRAVHDLDDAPCTMAALNAFRQYDKFGPVLFMEYVDGPSLSTLLARGRQSMSQSVWLCGQIAKALGHAHNKNVRHRDLKPNNIMLNKRNEVRVIDWGLIQTKHEARITLGVEDYFSPQRSTDPTLDCPADDIYALGVLLYQCLTGGIPLKPLNPAKLNDALEDAQPRIPQELTQTALAMLSDKEANRPTAAEVDNTILQMLDDIQAREIDQGFCASCGFIAASQTSHCPVCEARMAYRIARPPRSGMVRVDAGPFTHGLDAEQGRAALFARHLTST